MRLRRITREALQAGAITPELEKARGEGIPTFTHFLDLPILFLIVALGAIRPMSWTLFIVGTVVAVVIATALTLYIPKLYPWGGSETGVLTNPSARTRIPRCSICASS
jgi:hypothetical protein